MRYYDFLCPSVNFMGPGCVSILGERCQILNMKKPLIVTDEFLANLENGPVAQSVASLEAAGIEYVIFTGAEANPKVQNCYDGLKLYRENGCDSIITVGGGSAHDCGKGVGIAATHDKDLTEYAGIEKLENPLPPVIAVNTTAGTASEVTRHCVLTNLDTKLKFVIVSWRNVPLVSFNDPMMMLGIPAALTAATGMDALTHAVETYVSVDANPVTDAVAMQAIKLCANNLRQAVANGADVKARENMAYASLLAGMAFNNGNLGYVHAMAHQLGGQYDLPHGVANAMLLPVVEEYNIISNPQRFADIAEFMGENIEGLSVMDAAQKAIDAMRRLATDIGIPTSLKEMGVKEEDFDLMATNALNDGNAGSNPRKGNKQDIINLFAKAY
ncbi:MAG: iron-containing alcohol dehydrogenase [Lachnospiraceae bacterium]|nr:iron-containing alcohol dehydrogenase [Lachnospiraceae bacterium]